MSDGGDCRAAICADGGEAKLALEAYAGVGHSFQGDYFVSGKNKNQTAAERARAKEILGAVPSTHACASPTCPNPGKPIAMGELYPVISLLPRRHTVFYHRACGPKVTAGGG